MKSRNFFFSLLRFSAQLLPWNVYQGPSGREEIGLANSLNEFPIVFCALLGMLYLGAGAATSMQPFGLLPNGEFLLVRPVPRRTVYLSRVCLYFILMAAAPLLKISTTLAEPDLRISLYHGKTQSTEGADKLRLYQDQFPNNSIIRLPNARHDTFVIPFGATQTALFQFWLTILLALVLQTATLLILPPKVQTWMLIGICMVPMFLLGFVPFAELTTMMENAFFFFANHWPLIALLTFGAFVLVQRIALQRIENLEVI